MKAYKPVILFLVKFFITWIILVVLYNLYLEPYHSLNQPDPYSQTIANLTSETLNFLGFESAAIDDKTRPWTWIYLEGDYRSYINEGCNAISIMLIFVAFIAAFSTTIKQTLLYILSGLLIIQIMNVFRIVLLNYIFTYYKELGKSAHDYLFPAILYGTIVILWIVWVKFFALKFKPKNNE